MVVKAPATVLADGARLLMGHNRPHYLRALETLAPHDRMIAGMILAGVGILLATLFVLSRWNVGQRRHLLRCWVASQLLVFGIALHLANPYLGLLSRGWAAVIKTGSLLAGISILAIETHLQRRESAAMGSPNCRHCGYNLTGNTSGVCPECGQKYRGTRYI